MVRCSLFFLLLFSPFAFAQIGSESIPDLSTYASAIASAASGNPQPAAPAGQLFRTSLSVPTIQPGEAARQFGSKLRKALETAAGAKPEFARLEESMPGVLTSVESAIEQQGFGKRDLGVAIAYAFLYNYQAATKKQVADPAARACARTIAKAVETSFAPHYAKMAAAEKENAYESLLVITSTIAALAQQFDKAAKTQEADAMRDAAASIFRRLVGVDANQVTISSDGRISGLKTADNTRIGDPVSASGAIDPASPGPTLESFSHSLKFLTGDWIAERYYQGWLPTHPEKYNQFADITLKFTAPHILVDDPQKIADKYSAGFDFERHLVPATAPLTEQSEGVYFRSLRYHEVQTLLGQAGVVVLPNRRYAKFFSRCYTDREDDYPSQPCLAKVSRVLAALHSGSLSLPMPDAPLTLPGWEGRYTSDGTSMMENWDYFRTTEARVLVTSPRAISTDSMLANIQAFADQNLPNTSIRKLDKSQQIKEVTLQPLQSAAIYTGSRYYSERTGDAPFQIYGAIRVPDGRYSLFVVDCPKVQWQDTCTSASKSTAEFVASGDTEAQRLQIVRGSQPNVKNPLRGDQIEAVYSQNKTRMMAGGYFGQEQSASLMLLRDGSAYSGFAIGFDEAASKEKEPKNWGTWRRDGKSFVVTWPNGKSETIAATATRLAGGQAGQRISGIFSRVGGAGNTAFGGTSISIFQRQYHLLPDGHFTNDSTSAVNAGGALPNSPVVYSASNTAPTNSGTYTVEPYSLKLTYPDGRVVHLAFALFPTDAGKTQPSGIFLDGAFYFLEK